MISLSLMPWYYQRSTTSSSPSLSVQPTDTLSSTTVDDFVLISSPVTLQYPLPLSQVGGREGTSITSDEVSDVLDGALRDFEDLLKVRPLSFCHAMC
jgi:hypothetical protein